MKEVLPVVRTAAGKCHKAGTETDMDSENAKPEQFALVSDAKEIVLSVQHHDTSRLKPPEIIILALQSSTPTAPSNIARKNKCNYHLRDVTYLSSQSPPQKECWAEPPIMQEKGLHLEENQNSSGF